MNSRDDSGGILEKIEEDRHLVERRPKENEEKEEKFDLIYRCPPPLPTSPPERSSFAAVPSTPLLPLSLSCRDLISSSADDVAAKVASVPSTSMNSGVRFCHVSWVRSD